MDSVIESSVKIGKNTTIMPFCVITGDTVIGDNCLIESFSLLTNAQIGDNTIIKSSRITDSVVGRNSTVGPNAHLRENTVIGDNCRVGNFVEFKNSVMGDHSKASHLAYIGDAKIGSNCNVGCGVIFVNYDGKTKWHTTVGNNVFIGSNSNLIAPLLIEDDCYIACGTTVTADMKKDDFVIGRPIATVKPNRAHEYLNK